LTASPLTSAPRFAAGPVKALLIRRQASYFKSINCDLACQVSSRTHRKVDRRRRHLDGRAEGLRVDDQRTMVDRVLDSLQIAIIEMESTALEARGDALVHKRV
jgi:hypothetical protein